MYRLVINYIMVLLFIIKVFAGNKVFPPIADLQNVNGIHCLHCLDSVFYRSLFSC